MTRRIKAYRRPKPQPWWTRKWNHAKRQGVIVLAWIGAAALLVAFYGPTRYLGG